MLITTQFCFLTIAGPHRNQRKKEPHHFISPDANLFRLISIATTTTQFQSKTCKICQFSHNILQKSSGELRAKNDRSSRNVLIK